MKLIWRADINTHPGVHFAAILKQKHCYRLRSCTATAAAREPAAGASDHLSGQKLENREQDRWKTSALFALYPDHLTSNGALCSAFSLLFPFIEHPYEKIRRETARKTGRHEKLATRTQSFLNGRSRLEQRERGQMLACSAHYLPDRIIMIIWIIKVLLPSPTPTYCLL